MPLSATALVEVKWTPRKGRGVFARTFIPAETLIERVPMLVVPAREVLTPQHDTRLSHYVFEWGRGTVAIALGFGSLYNHSYAPNARYEDERPQVKSFYAVRDIECGEEVTINYHGSADAIDPVWFDVIESPTARNGREAPPPAPTPAASSPLPGPDRLQTI